MKRYLDRAGNGRQDGAKGDHPCRNVLYPRKSGIDWLCCRKNSTVKYKKSLDRIRAVLFVQKVDADSHIAQQRALPCEIQAHNKSYGRIERLQVFIFIYALCLREAKNCFEPGSGTEKEGGQYIHIYMYIIVCGREKSNGQTDLMMMCSGIGMRWSSARFTKMDDREYSTMSLA